MTTSPGVRACAFAVLSAMSWAGAIPTATSLAQETPVPADTEALEPGAPLEREMSGGEVHAYRLTLRSGQFLRAIVEQRGVDVVVNVIGPDGEELAEVDGPTGVQGQETVEVSATATGTYRLEIRPWVNPQDEEVPTGRYEIRVDELLTAQQYAARLAAEQETLEQVIAWVSEHAIPLHTVEAGHRFTDMRPLVDVVGDARIVALGEATHGTREFFQLKHRMLEFLVSEMGFTVFAMEAAMPQAFAINAYVLTGKGDPAEALAGLRFWMWDTEEVLDLIEWMRRYNADPRHERKVKFYGFDLQLAEARAARVTLDYLRSVDPRHTPSAKPLLVSLANPYTYELFDWPQDRKDAALSSIRALLDRFDGRRPEYVASSDSTSWALARQHVEVISQHVQSVSKFNTPDYFATRDSAMAENVRWILEREGPEAKMVLWAHNWHVRTEPPSMGAHLRETFGRDMAVFGLAFARGSFRALERPAPSKTGVRSFTVEPSPEGSLGWVLAEAGLQRAAIDLQEVPEEGPVAHWWREPHPVRNVGAGYSQASPSSAWAPQVIPDLYDALLFVESTTSARPNPSGQRVGWILFETPSNLDFEDGEPGEPPPGWLTGSFAAPWTEPPAVQRALGVDVETSGNRSYQGKRSGMLARRANGPYGGAAGRLGQRIAADPYRGKRVRLRAAVRTEVTGPGDEAYLWLRVLTKAYAFPPSIVFFDDMSDRPITHSEWREYEIEGEVPADAEVIDYGLALVGEGRAWIDAVTIDGVDEE